MKKMNPVEIPSNRYWGKKFGAIFTPKDQPKSDGSWGWHFPKIGFGSKASNTGKTVNKPETAQAKIDKKKFQEQGRPVIKVGFGNKRIKD